jgi:hypothetical protein
MPKADRVHSTPSKNTPTSRSHPVDATSRRRFLTNSKKIVGTVNAIAAEITGRLKSTSRSRWKSRRTGLGRLGAVKRRRTILREMEFAARQTDCRWRLSAMAALPSLRMFARL